MAYASPNDLFRSIRRRYRLPERLVAGRQMTGAPPAAALAFSIEQARLALENDQQPQDEWKQMFLSALAAMIQEALDEQNGDTAFQAMVMRHRMPCLREYVSLLADASQDRRHIHALVNRVAHPAKVQRLAPNRVRRGLENLHSGAASQAWRALQDTAEALLSMSEVAEDQTLAPGLTDLLQHPALSRLIRLLALSENPNVQRYQSLWSRQGPQAGSRAAIEQGTASQQRGAAVEASAAKALSAWARRLNRETDRTETCRVVTSMRVPASIPGDADRAKSEWDVVLLKRPVSADAADGSWNLCFLIEAKASVDAAVTDFPRLLRGLRLLGKADPNAVYPFQTKEGLVVVRGASLNMAGNTDDPGKVVLYCCEAQGEASARILSPASRMQLLSAPESLGFASRLAEPSPPGKDLLEPLWSGLLTAPKWRGLLHQYPMLRQLRELIVHVDDLRYADEN